MAPNLGIYCCCGACVEAAPANACGNCDDLTPNQYTVTFDSVAACSTCFSAGGTPVKVTYLSDPNNTPITVNKSAGGLCQWTGSVGNIRLEAFDVSDPTCAGVAILTNDEAATVTLTRNATTWDLLMAVSTGELFCDTQTANTSGADQLCATVPSFTNDITTCGGTTCPAVGGNFDHATGGTATVVCVKA